MNWLIWKLRAKSFLSSYINISCLKLNHLSIRRIKVNKNLILVQIVNMDMNVLFWFSHAINLAFGLSPCIVFGLHLIGSSGVWHKYCFCYLFWLSCRCIISFFKVATISSRWQQQVIFKGLGDYVHNIWSTHNWPPTIKIVQPHSNAVF